MQIFIPAIWIGSGICLFAGLQFCVYGIIRQQERVYLAFGILCLLTGGYMTLSARWYHAESIMALASIAKYEMGIICLIYPVFIWFLSLYTFQKTVTKFLIIMTLGFVTLFVINLWSPYSFLYVDMAMETPIMLPWGEQLNHYSLQTSTLAWPYYVLNYSVFIWAFLRCYTLWRGFNRRRALPITIYLILQLLVILQAEIIDNLGMKSVYLGEFAFLGLVILVTGSMLLELRTRSTALESNIASLHQETLRRKQYEEQLNYLAHHDYLTDLPNRRAMSSQYEAAVECCANTNTQGVMLLIDLDHFKMINDSLGHELGDQLLKQIAQRLSKIVPRDEPPIRLGGDEFAIFHTGLSRSGQEAQEQARQRARELIDEIVKPYRIAEHELVIGASIGLAIFGASSNSVGDTVKQADMALYRAKAAGRNSIYVYIPELKQKADQRLSIERHLRAAIETGDITLDFQPQVDLNNKLVAAEALARWRHPELGLVAPDDFIAVAEESGLIHALGEYVLISACQTISNWKLNAICRPQRLAINVSPWQLDNPGFVATVKDVLAEHAIAPGELMMEITESTFMRDIEGVAEKIRSLNEIGVGFSIDDFGTGYSALAWLKKLPLNELKIDRIFVHDMVLNPHDKVIDTILAIARHMDIRVIAEGVETPAQRRALESLGCAYFQGYLISPPLPAVKFDDWIQRHANTALT